MSSYFLLLSERNIKAIVRDQPEPFAAAYRDLEASQARTGLPFTADEKRRLAALSVFISVGLVNETGSYTPQPLEEATPA